MHDVQRQGACGGERTERAAPGPVQPQESADDGDCHPGGVQQIWRGGRHAGVLRVAQPGRAAQDPHWCGTPTNHRPRIGRSSMCPGFRRPELQSAVARSTLREPESASTVNTVRSKRRGRGADELSAPAWPWCVDQRVRGIGHLLAVLAIIAGIVTMHSLTVGHLPLTRAGAADVAPATPLEQPTHGAAPTMAAGASLDGAHLAGPSSCAECTGHLPAPASHSAAKMCLAVMATLGVALARRVAVRRGRSDGKFWIGVRSRALEITQALPLRPSPTVLCVLRT